MSDSRVTLPENIGSKLYVRRVTVSNTFMRRAPNDMAACDTEVLFGEYLDVYKETDDWAWGQLRTDFATDQIERKYSGYIGWVPKTALGDGDDAPTHIITAIRAPIFSAPDIKSPVTMTLHLNALVRARAHDDKFSKIAGAGFVHNHHIASRPQYDDFVSVAEAHLGLPYIWGGISTDGLDCSGLVRSSLRAVGQDAPRDADQQQAELGFLIDRYFKILERGDLVFWKGHVGIMQDNTYLIHANATHMCVKSEPLSEATKRIKPQSGRITAIKRLKI